jgi:maltose O-acetyltransferase
MATEREKMLRGELYRADDPELMMLRRRARDLTYKLNHSRDEEGELRLQILKELLGGMGERAWIEPPFYCDYGQNIMLGDSVFFNFNCVVLDVMAVTIGNSTMFGPNVQIYTATHPLDAKTRSSGLEFAKPIRIGDEVWVGGSVVINPGVTIGSRTVIGAGSVVTRDLPDDVFAAGNPCRVIRSLVE